MYVAFVLAFGLTALIGKTWSFLNQSTHAPLYSARLRRAYIGASNPDRFSGEGQSVRLEAPGDEVPLEEYRPEDNGGPLHLVTVTVNETMAGESQVEQRDRKGMNLAVGPGGISVGVRHHALWQTRGDFDAGLVPVLLKGSGFRVFQTKWTGP